MVTPISPASRFVVAPRCEHVVTCSQVFACGEYTTWWGGPVTNSNFYYVFVGLLSLLLVEPFLEGGDSPA